MNFNICIPSFNRPTFPALKWLLSEGVPRDRIYLFLHNDQQISQYRDSQNLKGIKIIKTRATCMTDQRNFILMNLYPLRHVQMDDDVSGINRIEKQGGKIRSYPVRFIPTVMELFKVARKNNCKVWGTGVYANPYFAYKQPTVSFSKFFRNNLVGIEGYRPSPELVGPVGTDWELGLCAIRDKVGLLRYNRIVLDVSLGTDVEVKGGIGTERYRFNGTFFREMAQRYVKVIGEKALRKFYPGLIKCLHEDWLYKCKYCGSGFWDELHWKIHKLYPCPEKRRKS